MINHNDKKFFKLAVGELKKDSNTELSCCCPVCDDTKNRLHLVYSKQGDFSYVKCWNAGCDLEEPTSVYNFLLLAAPALIDAYKRATLAGKIDTIKSNSKDSGLNGLLKKVKLKEEAEEFDIQDLKPENNPTAKYLPQSVLDMFVPIWHNTEAMSYLEDRGINPKEGWLFSENKFVTYNDKPLYVKDYIIIPLVTPQGVTGWYSRSILEKSFSTLVLEDHKKLWEETPGDLQYVAEGIFDILSTNLPGKGAMLGADLKDAPKSVTFLYDNDETGIRKSIQKVREGYKVLVWPEDIPEKDLNNLLKRLTHEEITTMVLSNILSGPIAEVKLRMKRR